MPNELDVIGLAVQSGAVGISGGLIWLLNKVVKGFKETIDNHMHESSQSMNAVAKSNIQVAKRMQQINDTIFTNQRELLTLANSAIKTQNNKFSQVIKKLKNDRKTN